MIMKRRWRRFIIIPVMGVVLFFSLALSSPMIALAKWGLVFSVPPDSGEAADAIVVLGRGEELRERRVEVVSKLWKAQRSPRIFISGMLDAREIVERLTETGFPRRAIKGESCSQTTEENAQFTTAILRPQKVRKILLVTDSPHMLRSLLQFRSFGFTVIPHSSSLPLEWNEFKQMRSIVREYVALATYALTNRFKERTIQELEQPTSQTIEKLATWNCKL